MAACAALGLAAGALGGAWTGASAPTERPSAPANESPALEDLPGQLDALRWRVARLERRSTSPQSSPAAAASPPAAPPPSRGRVTERPPTAAPPAQPVTAPGASTDTDEAPDRWERFGGRDNYGDFSDLVEDLPARVPFVIRRIERELALGPEAARTFRAAATAAGSEAARLGTAHLEGEGDLPALRRSWSALESRFRSAIATALTPEQREEVDRIVAEELAGSPWVGPLLRGPADGSSREP